MLYPTTNDKTIIRKTMNSTSFIIGFIIAWVSRSYVYTIQETFSKLLWYIIKYIPQ